MFLENIIIRGILMQAMINIFCIAALVSGYFALESDFDWNTYFAHAIRREDEREKQNGNEESIYKRLYGEKDTEYLLRRGLRFEKIVNTFLVVYLIISIVYLISCLLNKSVGRNKSLYECYFTVSFFVLLIAMAMQFLSMHTYDVNYIQWEIRNGKNITQYNEKTEAFERFYAKLYHPCTSESRLQMTEGDRLKLETDFGPNACQYYNTKLSVLIFLTLSWMFSFLIIVSVSNCSHGSYSKVTPEVELVKIADEGGLKKDNNDNYIEEDKDDDDSTESITTCKHSSNSSCISVIMNGNNNTERLLAKFRSELAVADDDE